MDQRTAISEINRAGALLVFPIVNRKEPGSLWSRFFPRKKMKWEWDDEDTAVGDLWRLMKVLSVSRKVVYSKWYQGRATFFSRELFTAVLSRFTSRATVAALSPEARRILEILEMDSPLSTREVKERADLKGRFNEAVYGRAMKELFARFLIVAYGEVDDGAFPSLAVGATRTLYEELWTAAGELSDEEAAWVIEKYLPLGSKWRGYLERVLGL